jgi:hypothetical protein
MSPFSVVDWLPIFVSETACKILTESKRRRGQETSAEREVRAVLASA